MFIEFKTIWKTKEQETRAIARTRNMPALAGPPGSVNVTAEWARRRIGVLFSYQAGMWTFIILIAPEEGQEVDGNVINMPSSEKVFVHLEVDYLEDPIANTRWTNGRLAFSQAGQHDIHGMMNYIAMRLKTLGPQFLEQIIRDIFWGWEEFLDHIRSTVLKVIPFIRCSF